MRCLILAVPFLIAAPAFAENITIEVNGMVCAYCAAGIEQLFKEEDGVEKVHVDLEKSEVHVTTTREKTLSDARIGAIVEEAGYEAGSVIRAK